MTLKVYGGRSGNKQVRTIVAAKSAAEVSRLVGDPVNHIRKFWSETGNAFEVAVATARPGVVFVATDERAKKFIPRKANK